MGEKPELGTRNQGRIDEGPLEELMGDTAMEDLTVEGTREETMAGWNRWTPRSQVVCGPMVKSLVRGAKSELAVQRPAV